MRHRTLTTMLIFASGILFAGLALGSGMEPQAVKAGNATMEQSQETATKILRAEQIREMQTLLRDRGYDSGAVDGVITPETSKALQQFQFDRGLATTGTPTQETLRALSLSTAQQEFFGLSPAYGEMEEIPAHEKGETEHKKSLY